MIFADLTLSIPISGHLQRNMGMEDHRLRNKGMEDHRLRNKGMEDHRLRNKGMEAHRLRNKGMEAHRQVPPWAALQVHLLAVLQPMEHLPRTGACPRPLDLLVEECHLLLPRHLADTDVKGIIRPACKRYLDWNSDENYLARSRV
jgi:hypothetical protein